MGSHTGFQFLNPLYGGIDYLRDDEFYDTRVAGTINGTPAAPGPGTRFLVDTIGTVSIANGIVTGTGNAAGDPKLVIDLPSGSHVAGRLMIVECTLAVAASIFDVGFDSDVTGIAYLGVRLGATGALAVIQNSTSGPNVGVSVAVTSYKVAVVLRSIGAGCHILIKGGAFTNWTLLWVENRVGNLVSYAGIDWRVNVATSSFIRVPAQLWLLLSSVSDSFNRGNGALGNTNGLAVEEIGGDGLPWTDNVGTWAILGNQAAASALTGGVAIATVDSGETDGIVTGTLTRSAGTLGIVLRYVDANNFMRAEHDGTNCRVITRIAGVEATAITAVVAIGAGVIRVISQDTSHSLYLNNVQVGATTVIAGLTTGTRVGLHTTDTGNAFDTFYSFARGTGGEYDSVLDNL